MNEVKQMSNYETESTWDNPQTGRVYSADGISPTLNTCSGGDRQPKIVEPQVKCLNTKDKNGRQPSQHDRVYDTSGIMTTIDVGTGGRFNILEPNSEGICNTLTSVQKDNLLLTPNNWKHKAGDGTKTRSRRISEIHPALQANTGASQQTYLAETPYRIRKLTPKECAKLMKFSDEDANKMLEVNSNTQVYKQCGNSIVVSVLEAIFCQMNIKGCPTWEEQSKKYL